MHHTLWLRFKWPPTWKSYYGGWKSDYICDLDLSMCVEKAVLPLYVPEGSQLELTIDVAWCMIIRVDTKYFQFLGGLINSKTTARNWSSRVTTMYLFIFCRIPVPVNVMQMEKERKCNLFPVVFLPLGMDVSRSSLPTFANASHLQISTWVLFLLFMCPRISRQGMAVLSNKYLHYFSELTVLADIAAEPENQ